MSETINGGPAFPVSIPGWGDNGVSGMTLRDWFAGMALQGMYGNDNWHHSSCEDMTSDAYKMADAMLKARR